MAAVVSASPPRLAASRTASRNEAVLAVAQIAASSECATYPDEWISSRRASNGSSEQLNQRNRGTDGFWSGVGGDRLPGSDFDKPGGIVRPTQRNRSKAHERTIAGGLGVGRTGCSVARAAPTRRSRGYRDADVEAGPSTRLGTAALPAVEALHEITLIEFGVRNKAVGESKSHGGIISPLTRLEPERSTANDGDERIVAIAGLELEHGSK